MSAAGVDYKARAAPVDKRRFSHRLHSTGFASAPQRECRRQSKLELGHCTVLALSGPSTAPVCCCCRRVFKSVYVHNCECNATQSLKLIYMWQNSWESNFRRPRHPRALDDQQLLAIEGSQKSTHTAGTQRPSGRNPKMPKNAAKTNSEPPQHRRETMSMNCWNLSLRDHSDVDPPLICGTGKATVCATARKKTESPPRLPHDLRHWHTTINSAMRLNPLLWNAQCDSHKLFLI